ncbi:hypothetical protein T492DRAFT_78204 [Pavlovales sp. CCMP2436]|nr:hypothetical protein T492DRAFT_78204 [Pavlovales sp. CCMP2436]
MAKVIGIAGASGSGKSTLASLLHAHYGCSSTDVIRLDAFYRESKWVHGSFDAQWESPDAIDFETCAAAVRRAATESADAYVFVEGFLLFHASPLLALFDTRILLQVSSRSALRRRHERGLDGLDLPTLDSVWTQVIWPSYVANTGDLARDSSLFRINAEAPVRAVLEEAVSLLEQVETLTLRSLTSGGATAVGRGADGGGGVGPATLAAGLPLMARSPSGRRPPPPQPVVAATVALFALLRAAREGGVAVDAATVRELIAEGALVDMPAADGETLLRLAVWGGHAPVAKLLLDARASVGQKTAWGGTALSVAADRGNTELAALLLGRGADANGRAPSGTTVLMFAAAAGHSQMVRLLVAAHADVHARDAGGQTVPESVQPLLLAGARIQPEPSRPLVEDCAPCCVQHASALPCGRIPRRVRRAALEVLLYINCNCLSHLSSHLILFFRAVFSDCCLSGIKPWGIISVIRVPCLWPWGLAVVWLSPVIPSLTMLPPPSP